MTTVSPLLHRPPFDEVYAGYNTVLTPSGPIVLHRPEDFEGMRRAGRLAANLLEALPPRIYPGVTTADLDVFCRDFIVSRGAYPAPLGYRGYPASVCTSVNHVVCHGVPGDRVLVEGDIVNVDVTVLLDGWHGDTSRTFFVGQSVPVRAKKLVGATFEALMRAIDVVRPGAFLGDIGHAIQSCVEPVGFSVVRDFIGHGLGRVFHMAPEVLHVGSPGKGPRLEPGMFFTIEPMINAGKPDVKILADGWTAVTRDRSLSAQFEHSLGVTETGCEIFTLP